MLMSGETQVLEKVDFQDKIKIKILHLFYPNCYHK